MNEETYEMTEAGNALLVLTEAGFGWDDALEMLKALNDAGVVVTRPEAFIARVARNLEQGSWT